MLRADFHMHTHFSPDCVTKPEALVERCLEVGLSCIAVTDLLGKCCITIVTECSCVFATCQPFYNAYYKKVVVNTQHKPCFFVSIVTI